ncbi:MAG: class I SAM-dependent methyltransferase [Candidatus Eremiobacteraeota bacterium]|nr:class I SAM-dependent methyltransferase [Candidatus Eremiobacteraeota bacterium]
MTSNGSFMRRVLAGALPSPEDIIEYLIAFHSEKPSATSATMKQLRTGSGLSSYDLLADVLAAEGPEALLDVGCGDGALLEAVALRVPTVSLFGVDISDAELELASLRLAAHSKTLLAADMNALPFPNERFDAVAAHLVLMLLPDPLAALREIRRVMRSGSLLAFSVPMSSSHDEAWEETNRVLFAKIREHFPLFRPPDPCDSRVESREGIAALLKSAGYTQPPHFSEFVVSADILRAQLWEILANRYVVGSLPEPLSGELESIVTRADASKTFRYSAAIRQVYVRR